MKFFTKSLQFTLTKKKYYNNIINSFNSKSLCLKKLCGFFNFKTTILSFSRVKTKLKNYFLIKKIQKIFIYLNIFNKYELLYNKKFYIYAMLIKKCLFFYKREFRLEHNLKFSNMFFILRRNIKKKKNFIKNTFLSIKKLSRLYKKKYIKRG